MSAKGRYDLRLVFPALAAWLAAMAVTTGRGTQHAPTRLVIAGFVIISMVTCVGLCLRSRRVRSWRGTVVLSAGVGLIVGCVAAMHAEVRHPEWVTEMESAPGPLTVTATIDADVTPVAGSALRGQPRWWLSVSDATITDAQGRTWTGASAAVVANQPEEPMDSEGRPRQEVGSDETDETATRPRCDRDQQPGDDVSWRCVAMGQRVTFTAAALPIDPVDGKTTLLLADPMPRVAAAPPSFTATITSLRDGLKDASAHLSAQGRGLVPGITIGDVTDLPDDIGDAMLLTSLTHITAVSGETTTKRGGSAYAESRGLRKLGEGVSRERAGSDRRDRVVRGTQQPRGTKGVREWMIPSATKTRPTGRALTAVVTASRNPCRPKQACVSLSAVPPTVCTQSSTLSRA